MAKNNSKHNGNEACCGVKTVLGSMLGLLFIGAGVMLVFHFWDYVLVVIRGLIGVLVVLCGAVIIAVVRD